MCTLLIFDSNINHMLHYNINGFRCDFRKRNTYIIPIPSTVQNIRIYHYIIILISSIILYLLHVCPYLCYVYLIILWFLFNLIFFFWFLRFIPIWSQTRIHNIQRALNYRPGAVSRLSPCMGIIHNQSSIDSGQSESHGDTKRGTA